MAVDIKRLISLDITTGSYVEILERIGILCNSNSSHYVCVANVHMVMEAYWNKQLQKIINTADVVTADGMPVAKGIEMLYRIKQDRVSGMDILPELLRYAELAKRSIALIGGTKNVHEYFEQYILKNHPMLRLTGMYDCIVTKDGHCKEASQIANSLNNSQTDIVLVSLGCPKQELFMGHMQGIVNGCMIGIGGALPVMIGLQKRAPIWMQKNSLEWFYRLVLEPKRLLKRYMKTNLPFLILLLLQLCKRKKAQGYFDVYYLFD